MGGNGHGNKPFFDPSNPPSSMMKPGFLGSHPLFQGMEGFPRPPPGDFHQALSFYHEELSRLQQSARYTGRLLLQLHGNPLRLPTGQQQTVPGGGAPEEMARPTGRHTVQGALSQDRHHLHHGGGRELSVFECFYKEHQEEKQL